jgi:hypothetical protein
MEGGDRQELEEIIAALGPILNKPGGHIEILPEDDIVKYIKRSGRASRDKVAVILSSEDIDRPNSIWRDPDKAVSIKATVLAVGDKLTGPNYLYLTGLIGLARAVMANERDKVGMYYKLLTGSDIDSNVLSLIDPAGSNNTIPFALKAVLKFRPINKIDPAILDSMRIAMENFLISA